MTLITQSVADEKKYMPRPIPLLPRPQASAHAYCLVLLASAHAFTFGLERTLLIYKQALAVNPFIETLASRVSGANPI